MKISADRGSNKSRAPVLLISNSAWNLAHFRRPIIKALVSSGQRVIAAAPSDGTEGRLIELGAEYIPLPLKAASRSVVGEMRLLAAILRIIVATRPRVVLTFTIKPNIYGSIAASMMNVRSLATISGLGSAFIGGGATRTIVTRLLAFALARTTKVFFQNSDDQALFVAGGLVTVGKTILVPGSGIDLDHFRPAPHPPADPFTFLMIGRLLSDKGTEEFVGAAQIFRDLGFDARFVMLGEIGVDNPSAVPKDQVARWVSDGLIEHLEPVTDVRPVISAAHCVVLPSYREGLPRSLLEGAAMARPLVATDVPGCRELVREGENGFLCAPRSADALATALQHLMSMGEAERGRMGRNGRALVERYYDERWVRDAYLEAIGE